jgi:GR25 family glycosyltransferase involved in LPS biosynthesis
MLSSQLIRINLSSDDLRDVYNQFSSEVLRKFLPNVKQYSLEDVDNKNDNNIRLTEEIDGNYWAVDMWSQDSNSQTDKDYILLPNKNKINSIFQSSQKDKFLSLFSFLGDTETKTKNFKLNKPAIVSYTSSNEEKWEVKEMGELEFIDSDPQYTQETLPSESGKENETDSQKELETLDDLLKRIENIEKMLDKIQNIQSQNYVTREQVENWIIEYFSKQSPIVPLGKNISNTKVDENSLETYNHNPLKDCCGTNFSKISTINSNTSPDLSNSQSLTYSSIINALEPSIINLVNIYNEKPKSLLQLSEVSENSQSIDNRRLGYNQPIALEIVSRNKGIAWVINIDGSDYLVPKPKLKINEYNYETIESLFICHGYESEVFYEFILIKPAKLLAQEKGEKWELSEKGELRFQTQSS